MGEYARCLSLARALQHAWPAVRCHFLLSREAPYAASTPFETHLLPASVTLSGDEVEQTLRRIRPALVVFDNAGRSAQLRAAQALGARTVYISSRRRQRRKAFRLRWMRRLDEHWLAYPADLFGPLTFLERSKLSIMGRPTVRFVDAMLAPADLSAAPAIGTACASNAVIFVPGGGSAHPGAEDLPQRFLDAARAIAASGQPVQFVAGPSFSVPLPQLAGLQVLRSLPGGALMAMLSQARLVVVNGGDTLVQALVLGKACLALPIAKDQMARVRWCVAHGVIRSAEPGKLTAAVLALLTDQAEQQRLMVAARALGWRDGLPQATASMARLLGLTR